MVFLYGVGLLGPQTAAAVAVLSCTLCNIPSRGPSTFYLKKKKKGKRQQQTKKKTKKTDCRVFCFGASNLHSIWVPWSPPSFFSSCIPVLSPAVSTWLWLLASFHSMNFNYFCFQTGFPAFIFPCSL